MKKEKETEDNITIYEWRQLGRGLTALGPDSDYFYCDIADKFYKSLPFRFKMGGFSGEDAKVFCVRLSLYLEDVVSDLGIFKAFRSICKERTGRDLPFYKNAKVGQGMYRENKVNLEDIQFLLWDYLQITSDDMEVISPFNGNIESWARDIYNVLYSLSKNAPKNEWFRDEFLYTEDIRDFHDLRPRMTWLLEGCYMTSIYYFADCVKDWERSCRKKLMGSRNSDEYTDKEIYDFALEEMLYFSTSRQFGLPLNKFYARMLSLKGYEDLAKDVNELFAYPRQVLKIADISDGKILAFNWDKENFVFELEKNPLPTEMDQVSQWRYLSVNVARYRGEDFIFGAPFQSHKALVDEMGLDENWETRVKVHEQEKKRKKEIYERALELAKNDKDRFFPNKTVLYREMGVASLNPVVEGGNSDPFYSLEKYLSKPMDENSLLATQETLSDIARLNDLFKFGPKSLDDDDLELILEDEEEDDDDETQEDWEDEDEDWEDDEEDWEDDDKDDDEDWEDDEEDWEDDDEEDEEWEDEDQFDDRFRNAENALKSLMDLLGITPEEVQKSVLKYSDSVTSDDLNRMLDDLSQLGKIDNSGIAKEQEREVLVVHSDQVVTHYNLCIPMLKLPENPYYNPRFHESVPFEYAVMTCYDYEYAKYLKSRGALIQTKDAPYSEPIKIRKFIMDNFEYLASYFYHSNFHGYKGGEMDYERETVY